MKKSEYEILCRIIEQKVMYLLENNNLKEMLIDEITYDIENREDIIIEDDTGQEVINDRR